MTKICTSVLAMMLFCGGAFADTSWTNQAAASAMATTLASASTNFSNDLRLAGAAYYIQNQADNYSVLTSEFNTSMASGIDYPTASAQFQQVHASFLNLRMVIQAQGTAIPYTLVGEFYDLAYNEKNLENAMAQSPR